MMRTPSWVRMACVPLRRRLVGRRMSTGCGRTPGRKARLDAGVGAVTAAKSYRLLQAIMNAAVEDELSRRNPCRIEGGRSCSWRPSRVSGGAS